MRFLCGPAAVMENCFAKCHWVYRSSGDPGRCGVVMNHSQKTCLQTERLPGFFGFISGIDALR